MKQFEMVQVKRPKTSTFDRSHENKLTVNPGELVPFYLEEVVPGDKFKISAEAIVRFMPLLAPIMHRVNVYTHYFYVPNRIIWDEWNDFISGGETGELEPNFPKITGRNDDFYNGMKLNSLGDYLGIPVEQFANNTNPIEPFSALPFRAYQKIYNDYYRDQNLITEVPIPTDSDDMGFGDASEILQLRKRAWEKDYFTSALPFAQKGDPVRIPLGTSAPVSGYPKVVDKDGNPVISSALEVGAGGFLGQTTGTTNQLGFEAGGSVPGSLPELHADLANATSATINDWRTAMVIQRWKEKLMRGGSRINEYILHVFGKKTPDARLQRAEYLGGGKIPVRISEVLQTSETNESPQGTMAGHGFSAGNFTGTTTTIDEHGFIIGIVSIQPRTGYFNGMPKILNKFNRFDYLTPDFAHIGEQPIYNRELYWKADNPTSNSGTFGYQERYAEYRQAMDTIHGDLRNTLMHWHWAKQLTDLPTLSQEFIECVPDDRIYPTDGVEAPYARMIVYMLIHVRAIRPLPKFGTPI